MSGQLVSHWCLVSWSLIDVWSVDLSLMSGQLVSHWCSYKGSNTTWAMSWENLLYAINKGADPPACSLISAFIVHCLDNIIPILAKSKISRLASLCSLAGQFVSYLITNPPKTGFLVKWLSSTPCGKAGFSPCVFKGLVIITLRLLFSWQASIFFFLNFSLRHCLQLVCSSPPTTWRLL